MAEKREERERQNPERMPVREGRGGERGGEMGSWRPFGDLESWLTPWEGLFPRRRFLEDIFRDFGSARRNFVPAVELSENDQSYTITVEIPGVDKDDVHVDLREGMLLVHGEKKSEREEKKERGRYLERTYGSFCRTFTLPPDADADRMEASFKNGLLRIQIPRSEESKPRQISIQS